MFINTHFDFNSINVLVQAIVDSVAAARRLADNDNENADGQVMRPAMPRHIDLLLQFDGENVPVVYPHWTREELELLCRLLEDELVHLDKDVNEGCESILLLDKGRQAIFDHGWLTHHTSDHFVVDTPGGPYIFIDPWAKPAHHHPHHWAKMMTVLHKLPDGSHSVPSVARDFGFIAIGRGKMPKAYPPCRF